MEVSEDVTAVTLGQAVESLHKLKLAIKDHPTVTAGDSPTVTGKNGPTITGGDGPTIIDRNSPTITAGDNPTIIDRNGPTITAGNSSSITAGDSSSITAEDSSSITAGDSSSVTAGDSSSITAGDSSSITAEDSSSITAGDNSSITAGDRSLVTTATVTDPSERVDFFAGVRPKVGANGRGRADSRRRAPGAATGVLAPGGANGVLCLPTVESTRPLLSASPVPGIEFLNYVDERQMPEIMQLIQRDLSEPYSIYTYRYFINNWPNLCFLARCEQQRVVGAIVCKLDSSESHKRRLITNRGYIAMLAVDKQFRKRNIGSLLVRMAIKAMVADGADEVVLETEVTNDAALRLYENLGFVRDKRLFRYYLNGVDALRLKLWLWPP